MGNSIVDSQKITLTGAGTVSGAGGPGDSNTGTGASTSGGNTVNLPGVDLDINSIQRIITGIACWTMSTILAVMVIALVVAGVRFYIGGAIGDVASAKRNLLWVLIGITVILGTNVIIATIAYSLGADYRSYIPLSCTNVSTNTTYE